jgi:hypothetical protein
MPSVPRMVASTASCPRTSGQGVRGSSRRTSECWRAARVSSTDARGEATGRLTRSHLRRGVFEDRRRRILRHSVFLRCADQWSGLVWPSSCLHLRSRRDLRPSGSDPSSVGTSGAAKARFQVNAAARRVERYWTSESTRVGQSAAERLGGKHVLPCVGPRSLA